MGQTIAAWLHATAVSAWSRRAEQRGQGTVEYVGVVVMVTLLVAGLAVASRQWVPELGGALRRGLASALRRLNGLFTPD